MNYCLNVTAYLLLIYLKSEYEKTFGVSNPKRILSGSIIRRGYLRRQRPESQSPFPCIDRSNSSAIVHVNFDGKCKSAWKKSLNGSSINNTQGEVKTRSGHAIQIRTNLHVCESSAKSAQYSN